MKSSYKAHKSHKDVWIGIGFIVLVIIVIFSWNKAPKNTEATPPSSLKISTLAAENSFYDFKSISMAKGKVTTRYTIKNTGTESLVIQKFYTSCMCTKASLITAKETYGPFGMLTHGTSIPTISATLTPGETAKVEVTFDPAAHGPAGLGKTDRVVKLENSAGRPLELKFSAFVTP